MAAGNQNEAFIDTKEFDRAMGQYLSLTSKSMEQVANDTARKWMYKSASRIKNARRDEIKRVVENPKFITYWLDKKHGKGNWNRTNGGDVKVIGANGKVKYTNSDNITGRGAVDPNSDWADAVKALKRRLSSVGYMKSGFIKAAKKFPDSGQGQSGKAPRRSPADRHKGTKAQVIKATRKRQRAAFVLRSKTRDSADLRGKQRILDRAFKQAQHDTFRDMQPYIKRKMKEAAAAVSVKK